jgi:hypothetical protein
MSVQPLISKPEARMTIVLTIFVTLLLCPFLLVTVQALQDYFGYVVSPNSLLYFVVQQCRWHMAISILVPLIYIFSPLASVVYIVYAANSQTLAQVFSRSQHYLILFFVVNLSVLVPVPFAIMVVSILGILFHGDKPFSVNYSSLEEWVVSLMPQTIVCAIIISGLPFLIYRVSELLDPRLER